MCSDANEFFEDGLELTYENVKKGIMLMTDEEVQEHARFLGIEIDITAEDYREVLAKIYWDKIEKGKILF
jgi:hypothetical protein